MKQCRKCGEIKPLHEFYKHNKMHDGYFNQCKACKRVYAVAKNRGNSMNPEWVLRERERTRDKFHRLGYNSRSRSDKNKSNKSILLNLSRDYPLSEGFEYHHWNYLYPYDVFVLSRSEHKRVHSGLKFNETLQIFELKSDGRALSSIKLHLDYIESILGRKIKPICLSF